MEEKKTQYCVLDENGKVLCCEETTMEHLDLKDVTTNNIVYFHTPDINELKEYAQAFEPFGDINPWKDVDIEKCSFLEVQEDGEGGFTFL